MASHTRINVYALENYVIAATAAFSDDDHQQTANIDVSLTGTSNQKARNKKGDSSNTNNNIDAKNNTDNRSKVSAKNKRGRELEQLQQQQEEEQKQTLINCKTPLEKLISLKIRYTRQNSCVLSVEGVLLVHAHRHTHILLLKQHVQKRKNVTNRTNTKGGNDMNITTRPANAADNKSDERNALNAVTGSSVITREITNAAAVLSDLFTASSIANVQSDVVFRLPGGRCRRGESEENCLIRKLGRLLLNEAKVSSVSTNNNDDNKKNSGSNIHVSNVSSNTTMMNSKSNTELAGGSTGGHLPDTILDVNAENEKEHQSQAASFFHVGELIAKWYRPHFSPLMYPYIPPHISPTSIKEMRSVFLVQVEPMMYFNVVQCMDAELVAVPLFDLYDNSAKYGPVISALPSQLSRILIEYCNVEY